VRRRPSDGAGRGDVRRVFEVAGVDGALPLYDDVVASNHDA
jgi:hypothetical protein